MADKADKKQNIIKRPGPRLIFIEKYKETGSIEEAKKALEDNGMHAYSENISLLKKWAEEDLDYKNDDVLLSWINEKGKDSEDLGER